ncbi:MAG: hypothetical protein M1819_003055 [Sarea resinae]|nr:MAG: hypothetical protein M1819_003055 [Sarea resinae]
MAFPYLDTPRTDAGNATSLTNGLDLNMSIEQSFQSPSNEKNDLIKQMQGGRRGPDLRTPRSRAVLGDRRNQAGAPQAEFTPLLKSVTKKNLLRRQSGGRENAVPQTPVFLKPGYRAAQSPALPGESSGLYEDHTGSSYDGEATPVPQVASSSATSTPLAVLPKRDGGGMLADSANAMTLREQENIINKIEKENFGLKLKIHFLEDSLRKAGPGFSEAALKENTDLKVEKVTLSNDLRRYKKTLLNAEREVEMYRQQLMDVQEKVKRKHMDESQREELARLQSALEEKEDEIQDLREKLESAQGQDQEVEKLRDEIGDLEGDLREKDRIIEEREDEIAKDEMKANATKDSNTAEELAEQLETAQGRVQELELLQSSKSDQAQELESAQQDLAELEEKLEDLQERAERAESEARDAREDRQEALEEKQHAEDDLNELRDEMANKSFTTKGLSRQLEEKTNKLQDELESLREDYTTVQAHYQVKVRETEKLQQKVESLEQDSDSKERALTEALESAQNECDAANQERNSLSQRLQAVSKDLENKSQEKALLQTRHDALTDESQGLQKELAAAQSKVRELERKLDSETQLAFENDHALREQGQEEIDTLQDEVDSLHRKMAEWQSQFDSQNDRWETQRRSLETQRDQAEDQAAGLKRTIEKLQEAEGTLSGREMKLKEALDSENERHRREETLLSRQIQELQTEVDSRRRGLEEVRGELARVKEDLRISKRQEEALTEKTQGLEDEIEVLQGSLDEESERAREEVSSVRAEAEGLRRQLHTLKQDLAKAQNAHADAQARIETFQGNLQAGEGSKEQLAQRLQEIEIQLTKTKKEKQNLQDQLANVNIEMHNLKTASAETEAERDEMKSQLKQMQEQVDETFRLDQEKIDLRKTKIKLESDLSRVKDERRGLLEKNEALEKELEIEIEKASSEEARLVAEVEDLQRRLSTATEGKDRELMAARRNVQRLELQLKELESLRQHGSSDGDTAIELSMIRHDLSNARNKEAEYLQREATNKETVRQLRLKIADLERDLHEVEMSKLLVDSPKSSVSGSARKSEVDETRRQLAEAHQQMKELRAKTKDVEREAQRKLIASDREHQYKLDTYEKEREELEAELVECRLQRDEQKTRSQSIEQTLERLRTRIRQLEKDLHTARLENADQTIAEERKDLHDMVKESKLEVEELQLELSDRDRRIETLLFKETELRASLQRVRQERGTQAVRAEAATGELELLQRRYELAMDDMARLQETWEEERRALTHKVRFVNTSVSSVHETAEVARLEHEIKEKEKRHLLELKGLAKQMQYLRAKCKREEMFRSDLAFSKKYMLMQINMYTICNKAELQILADMGLTPDRSIREKRPTFKVVAWMVLSSVRMKRLQSQWAENKTLYNTLLKKREQARRASRKITGH